jgi:hypothetical protein
VGFVSSVNRERASAAEGLRPVAEVARGARVLPAKEDP